MAFDPDRGFSLNGSPLPLHGVAMHQDYLGKGWAITERDTDESLALVREIGANTLRLAHYPHAQHTLQRADEMGLVVWAEVPFVNGVRLSCSDQPATEAFAANVEQQLRELIRQQYNHASIAMWSIGNENTMTQGRCDGADNVTPVLRRLHEVAKAEDPGRATTLADLSLGGQGEGKIRVSGITDVWALNRYHMWYYGDVDGLVRDLDGIHAKYPRQPVGISEYGAGAALSDHTDNPLGGPPTPFGIPGARVYQPEEYAAFVHERIYEVLASRPFVWGTYVWAMFDFGSGIRYEGDLRGVNTKGLVTFDRKTRKDPFYFYKANWSAEPVTHIVGRRYTDRAYATTDVKVYSNADAVALLVNGAPVGTLTSSECPFRTCVFRNVALRPGRNVIAARGTAGQRRAPTRWCGRCPAARTSTSPPASSPPASGRPTARGTGPTTSSPEVRAARSCSGRAARPETSPRSGGSPRRPTRSSTRRIGRAASGTTSRCRTATTGWSSASSSRRRRPGRRARVRRRSQRHESDRGPRRAARGGRVPHGADADPAGRSLGGSVGAFVHADDRGGAGLDHHHHEGVTEGALADPGGPVVTGPR